MEQDRVFFETLKVDRGWYFVEYIPPIPSFPFATVQLVFPDEVESTRVAGSMEAELAVWLQRYPVPVMISSFDAKGSLIVLDSARACDHLIGWPDPTSGKPASHWRIVENSEFPRASWDSESLKSIYADIPFRTSTQLNESAKKEKRVFRFGWWLLFIWAVAVPACIALVEFNAPNWLAWLVLGYSILRAYIEALKLLGKWPKTDSELSREEEDRRMRHHHYHCEQNPEGFRRLKLENFERDSRQEIQLDAAALKADAPQDQLKNRPTMSGK